MSFGFGFGLPSWRTLAGGFTPASLFVGGVQGTWYDPSDFSTLFQDSAGTTPVTGVEQVVGLMLDKRVPVAATGYYSGVFDGTGDYLTCSQTAVGTSDATVEFWIYPTDASVTYRAVFDSRSTVATNTGFGIFQYGRVIEVYGNGLKVASAANALNINSWNHLALTRSSGTCQLYINGAASGASGAYSDNLTSTLVWIGIGANLASPYIGYISNLRVVVGAVVYSGATYTVPTTPLTAISGTSLLTCQNSTFIDNSPNAFTITAVGDAKTGANNPFGNHAFQTNGIAKPTLRARYNLLEYSEQFDNAYWTKAAVTVTTNTAVAPDGTTTADTFTEVATTASHGAGSSLFSFVSGVQYTISAYAKNAPGGRGFVQLAGFQLISGPADVYANFDIVNGTVTAQSNGVGTIQSAGNGWWRCALTFTCTRSASERVNLRQITAGNAAVFESYLGDVTKSIFWLGAQLLTAADAFATGNAYQRIAAATVYDTSNSVFRPYLDCGRLGSTSAMVTGSINPGAVDKAQVFAGVTKLSDAASGVVAEISADAAVNNGSLVFAAPGAAGANSYQFQSRGTNVVTAGTGATNPAPTTNVVSNFGDISGDSAIVRVNGVQAAINTSDQGTGNYLTYPLNIASRNNGASLRFVGRIYSLITRFGPNLSAAEINSTEAWVNQRTGAF